VKLYARFIFPWLCDFLLGRPFLAPFRRELLADVAGDILEIGFGTGLNLPFYPAAVRRITTVDPSPGMHRLAQRRIRRSGIAVDQHCLNGEHLPFADGVFDGVVSTFTLCSIAHVAQALREVHRVLKPGGRFWFLEHGLCPARCVQQWQRRLNWLEMSLADGCRLDRDIRALLAAVPFRSVACKNAYLPRIPRTHGYLYQGKAVK